MIELDFSNRAECERQLMRLVDGTALGPALSRGAAGIALMQGQLFRTSGEQFRAAAIEQLLSVMVDSIEQRPLSMALWQGLPGLLYSFEFLRGVDRQLLGQHAETIVEFVTDMDGALCSYIDGIATSAKYDLISGVCGVGLYAMMRSEPEAGRALYASVEAALVRMSDTSPEGRYWKTSAANVSPNSSEQHRLEGRVDLGVAHGVAGVIGLMALALRLDIHTASTRALLQDAVAWTMGTARAGAVSTFGNWHDAPASASARFAWCYGDLGICAALASAGLALGQASLLEFARTALVQRVQHGRGTLGLVDPWLCHGYAGCYHVLASFNRIAPDAQFAPVLEMLHASSMQEFTKGTITPANVGLLEGYSGLLLATEAVQEKPPLRPWDLCLATSL